MGQAFPCFSPNSSLLTPRSSIMSRVSLKVTGAQGQGVNSVGEMCAKGLKRAGYCVFGYREYNSLIKGGYSSYQLDISERMIRSTEEQVDILVCFNHHGLYKSIFDVKEGGIVIHQSGDWQFDAKTQKELKKRDITVLYLPTDEILLRLKAKPILANVLISAVVWSLLGRSKENLQSLVREQFGHKKDLLDLNLKCIDEGFAYRESHQHVPSLALPKPDKNRWNKDLLVTGSQAMGLGLVHAGVRLYAGYPMTPSSPLLTFIAEIQNETGMVIKQAEDEITAAQMVTGAMHMGTRAVTATSGGGFDLMTETVSLNGIIENPSVFILAQRPGPATGLPTWTTQGDLFLAIHGGHGEFARCVMAVSDSQDSFDLMNEAFNMAEIYQTPVIVLTDKQIAEALWTQQLYNQKKAKIRRGKLVTEPAKLAKLKSTDRFDPKAKDGISYRWLPGAKAATYNAQGDEHSGDGSIDESAANAIEQMQKRMRKLAAMKEALPEPELFLSGKEQDGKVPALDVLLIGWGSSKGVVLDVLEHPVFKGVKIGYLHYTYLWPFKAEYFGKLAKKAGRLVVVEGNFQSQLEMLIRQETGFQIDNSILKYDGRPFFYDELLANIHHLLMNNQ
jgi:2-oxoglutarate/2-oxoacid ferredoxin oxidoreductase subunit alpha